MTAALETCPRCAGTGLKYCDRSRVKCPECGGAKTVPVRTYGQYRCQVCITYKVPLWLFCGTCNRNPISGPAPVAYSPAPVATVMPTPLGISAPPAAVVVRGVCGAGPGPCGAPNARLFTCGWRCEAHKPGEPITVTRPPLVIAVRLDVCGCGGPLLSPVDGPTTPCPDCQEVAA